MMNGAPGGPEPPVGGVQSVPLGTGAPGGVPGLDGGGGFVGHRALPQLPPATGKRTLTPVSTKATIGRVGAGQEGGLRLHPTPPPQPPSEGEFVKSARASVSSSGGAGGGDDPHRRRAFARLPSRLPLKTKSTPSILNTHTNTRLPSPLAGRASVGDGGGASASAQLLTAHDAQRIRSLTPPLPASAVAPLPVDRRRAPYDECMVDEGVYEEEEEDHDDDNDEEEDEEDDGLVASSPTRGCGGGGGVSSHQQPQREDIGALALLTGVMDSADFDDGVGEGEDSGGDEGGGWGTVMATPIPERKTGRRPQSAAPPPTANCRADPSSSDLLLAVTVTSPVEDGGGGGGLSLALVTEEGGGGGGRDEDPRSSARRFSAEELMTYGRHLGINPVFEPDLLWIAEQALGAPLPSNWSERVTPAVGLKGFGSSARCLRIEYSVVH